MDFSKQSTNSNKITWRMNMASRKQMEKNERRRTNAADWAGDHEGFENTAFKLPDSIDEFKLKPGKMIVDFMEYIVGDGNPRADKGFIHFEREFSAHRIPTTKAKS